MFLNYYLVEITLPQSLYQDFIKWLNPHRAEMVSLPCFTHSTLFSENNPSEPDSMKLEVRYFYENENDLNEYFKTWAPRMRSSLPLEFQKQLQFKRFRVQAEGL